MAGEKPLQRRRSLSNGRSAEDKKFVRIMRDWTTSGAYRCLSGNALKIWIEVYLRDPAGKNEPVNAGVRSLASAVGLSVNTTNKALKELLKNGFLEEMTAGFYSAKGGQRLARTVRRSFDFMQPEKSQRLSQNQDMTVSKTETPTSSVPADRRKL
jgi:CRISPR/Cas system-associated protein Cas7 (RAMP superfamily)